MGQQWIWVKTNIPPKNPVSKAVKEWMLAKAQAFLKEHYIAHIPPPPKNPNWSYVIDYKVKWRGSYLYFMAKYACPSPNAISPEIEVGFARLGCFSRDRFSLWARRHNDQWLMIEEGLSLEECFERMKEDPWFEL
jgi:hypothetical protein